MHTRIHPNATLKARFLAKVDASGGRNACWPFRGCHSQKSHAKYPCIRPGGRQPMVLAAAVALILSGRRRPFAGAEPCHLCHNSECVNPTHLEWGTHSRNIVQQWKKRRGQRFGVDKRSTAA